MPYSYTRTPRAFTPAVTAFTAALSTDIHSAACTSSAADPWTRSTAKHAATAILAADAAAAGNSTTAFHTVIAILTHQPIEQQPTQQHSQQTSQQQMAQSTTSSSQLRVMSPPVTTPDIRHQGSQPLTSTPTVFPLSPPTNPPSVDSQYFNNIPNTSQDVSFGAINMPQFQAVENTSTTQPDQPASGDQ